MLKLRDFFHLPQVDSLVQKLVKDGPGLILLAGIDAHPVTPGQAGGRGFKPSGLSAIFNILMQEILLDHPDEKAVVIAADRALAKVPRQISRRVRYVHAEPPVSYQAQIELAIVDRPGLLVIDHLTEESLPPAFRAAQSGLRVLTQVDTILRGSGVARQLVEMGLAQDQLAALRWIVTCQRMPVLCQKCKQPVESPEETLRRLTTRFPELRADVEALTAAPRKGKGAGGRPAGFYRAGGCEKCRGTGYSGDVAVFDMFRNDPQAESIFTQESLLSLEAYALHLAAGGELDLNDLLQLENNHLRQVYQMYTASQQALAESTSQLNRKLLELEASNRVLVQRTEVLISLQDLGQALITSANLNDLAARICRRASELCGADRVVLYLRRVSEGAGEAAEILAERGWGGNMSGRLLEGRLVFGQQPAGMHAARYMNVPPGFRTYETSSGDAGGIKTGMRVPLVAQDELVGAMIVQSTQKEFFNQGEAALLQTFANQAALAIQRARLVDELRAKIAQLEAAQAELVKKERIEHELALAREVQQSMLPHSFARIPGFALAARNEPARQVGGDFYDVIVLDDDHFGIVVADVADKGLPAALYMSLTRSLLLAEARRTCSPRETLMNVNRLLLELGELNGFVSVFYGVVQCSTRRLTYARAGHERPLLLRQGQAISLGGEGPVLGILEGEKFELSEEETELAPGDLLFLYTDGLVDVLNAAGHFSGFDPLKQLLEAQAGKSADAACAAVFEELTAYRGPVEQFDDMTLLVLDVTGEDAAPNGAAPGSPNGAP